MSHDPKTVERLCLAMIKAEAVKTGETQLAAMIDLAPAVAARSAVSIYGDTVRAILDELEKIKAERGAP